jgi:hypothetical protein
MQPEHNVQQPQVWSTSSAIGLAEHWEHWLARWGYRRNQHRVQPGLYTLGQPNAESPVFVTANYTLSFDALREALAGVDGYILVLDTHGINVWCAAGKGTFGTQELLRRIVVTQLGRVVKHRTLILPQLGAAGVSAHEVQQSSGFHVEYGPVRAADLPAYMRTHQATLEMRRVRFDLWDRIVLIPMEFVHLCVPLLVAVAALYLLSGRLAAMGLAAAVLSGVAVFPVLLPYLPFSEFSTKGFVLGVAVALPFGLLAWLGSPGMSGWLRAASVLSYCLSLPAITAYLALNFTGSTPLTSRTGVKREIYTYIPWMAATFGVGLVLTLTLLLLQHWEGR